MDFEDLYHRHNSDLRAVAGKRVKHTDIDDVVSTSWMNAWKFQASYRSEVPVRDWLRKIVINECKMYWRAKSSAGRNVAVTCELETMPLSALPVDRITAERRLSAVERLEIAMAHIAPKDRTIFLMRFELGMEVPEISAKTSIRATALKTKLYRAQKRAVQA